MNRICQGVLVAAAVLASPAALAAPASAPICADRPGKGTATCTVPKGRFQTETALANWSHSDDSEGSSTSLSLLQTAFKYGVGEHTHVELDVTPWVRNRDTHAAGTRHASGLGDSMLKLKQELPGAGALSAALVVQVKLPTATRKIGNGRVEGGLVLPLSLQLANSHWSLSASPELDAVLDEDGHGYHPAMAQSVALGFQAAEAVTLTAELWGSWDWDESHTRQASFDPSVAYLPNDDVQLDVGANIGLTKATADLEVYGGVSVRF